MFLSQHSASIIWSSLRATSFWLGLTPLVTSPGILHAAATGPHTVMVRSPDGRNSIALHVSGAMMTFEVCRDGRQLVKPSPAGLEVSSIGRLTDGAVLRGSRRGTIDEEFTLPWGKTCHVRHQGSYGVVTFRNGSHFHWQMELRAYNDGVAFRYVVPRQERRQRVEVHDESTWFRFAGHPQVLFNSLDSFTTSHEATYEHLPLQQVPAGRLMDCPVLLEWPEGPAAAVTEARVRQFAGMYLERPSADSTNWRCRLSPLPGREHCGVIAEPPLASPWRVVLLSDCAGRLLESNLLLCLNEPAAVDFNWVKPGKTTFPWWNSDFERDHELEDERDTFVARHRNYIDFCARHKIPYHAVSGDGRPWYPQASPSYATPGPDADARVARPELDLPSILSYARERGVRIRLWVHWEPLSAHLEEALAIYASWGVAGLMVDFLDRDDQEMIAFTERLLETAARHRIHIQIHGSSKYSGEQRTFPHLLNREGVLNLEYVKWSNRCAPDHDVRVAFTRALAGPVDYHLGGFRAVSRADFQPVYDRPVVMGTRCHHLALYLIFENPMPMGADSPTAYDGQAGFEFIRDVPTTWDETRFVCGDAGEYLILARRKGWAWYLGGITNWSPRDVNVPLDFLGPGSFTATLYTDAAADESRLNELCIARRTVDASRSIRVSLAPGGGFVGVLSSR